MHCQQGAGICPYRKVPAQTDWRQGSESEMSTECAYTLQVSVIFLLSSDAVVEESLLLLCQRLRLVVLFEVGHLCFR